MISETSSRCPVIVFDTSIEMFLCYACINDDRPVPFVPIECQEQQPFNK